MQSSLKRSIDWKASKGLRILNGASGVESTSMRRSKSALTNLLSDSAIRCATSTSECIRAMVATRWSLGSIRLPILQGLLQKVRACWHTQERLHV